MKVSDARRTAETQWVAIVVITLVLFLAFIAVLLRSVESGNRRSVGQGSYMSEEPTTPFVTQRPGTSIDLPRITLPDAPEKELVFPDLASTGVPADYPLELMEPNPYLRVTEDIDGVEFRGMIVIDGPNVRITNSRIIADTDAFGIWNRDGHEGTEVHNVEIICRAGDNPTSAGVVDVGLVTGVDVSGCADGMKVRSGAEIRGNYIHDLAIGPNVHADGIQMQGGTDVLIEGNTIIAEGEDFANAAVFIQSESGRIENVVIRENYAAGFGFTLRLNGARITESQIVDNVIGREHQFGPVHFGDGAEQAIKRNVHRGNIYPDGTPID